MYLNLRPERGVCAGPVVLPVSKDHAPVKSCVSGSSGRDDLKFCGLKVLLADSVIIVENPQDCFFDRFFSVFLISFFRFPVRVKSERPAADDQIQSFAIHYCRSGLFELFLGEMDQKIRDKEYRIILVLAYAENYSLTALLYDHAMDRERNSHILVFLDPSVIMRIQKSDIAVLVHGILLDIKSRRVNMGSKDIEAVLKGVGSDLKKDHRLVHPYAVNSVARRESFPLFDRFTELNIAVLFRFVYKPVDTFALCLSVVKKVLVIVRQIHAGSQHAGIVIIPCIYSFH